MPASSDFCERNTKGIFLVLFCGTIILIAWILIYNEDLIMHRTTMRGTGQSVPANDKVPPLINTIQPNTFQNAPLTRVAPIVPPPKPIVQFIERPAHTGFQNSLKDAVNSIITSVCDIHATRAKSSPKKKYRQQPPFSRSFRWCH